MEKERGMEERSATPALQEFPQLSLLHFLSPQNQDLVKAYLIYIRARRYGPAMQEGTIRALKNFIVLMPEARQATLAHDLTQTTATDVDAWIEAAFRHPLAPSTVATRLRGLPCKFHFHGSWCPTGTWELCRKFCSEGHEGPVGPVWAGIKRPGSRTIRPQ